MKQLVTRQNCNEVCKIDYDDLLALAGYFPNLKEYNAPPLTRIKANHDDEVDSVKIDLDHPYFANFQRVVELGKRRVENSSLIKQPGSTVSKIGIKALLLQVEYGIKHEFRNIYLDAFGVPGNPEYSGHYVWGEIGFLMCCPQEIEDFTRRIADTEFSHCRNIGELLAIPAGRESWKNVIGCDWLGEFDLADGSDSRRILREYIDRNRAMLTENQVSLDFYPRL